MILKLFSVFGEPITIDTDCIVSLTLWNDEWTKIEWFKNVELMTKIVRESPQEIFRLMENQTDIQEDMDIQEDIPEHDKKMADAFYEMVVKPLKEKLNKT